MACPGNAAQLCGAGNRLSVYDLAPPPATPSTPAATYTSLGCYTELSGGRALASGKCSQLLHSPHLHLSL